MDIKKIEYFVNVVQYESFTRAAEKLFVSQPILSRSVREIEDELSQTLINRTSKQFQLTEKGEIFYEEAVRLLEQHKQLETIFKDSNKSNRKELVVAGTGLMASHIAEVFSCYGVSTTIYGLTDDKLESVKRMVNEDYAKYQEEGYYSRSQFDVSLQNINYTTEKRCFENADYIVKCVNEEMDIKKAFYNDISGIASETAIVASTTNRLSLSDMSEGLSHPERFLGLHWIKPASVVPLVEIVRTGNTSDEVVNKMYDYLMKVENIPVIINKEVPGFVSQRLQYAMIREAASLVNSNVISKKDLDLLVKNGLSVQYMAMGIFEMMDWEGIDDVKLMCEKILPDLDDSIDVPEIIKEKYDNGNLGLKSGEGFYSYPEDVGGIVLNNWYNAYYIIERLIYNR